MPSVFATGTGREFESEGEGLLHCDFRLTQTQIEFIQPGRSRAWGRDANLKSEFQSESLEYRSGSLRKFPKGCKKKEKKDEMLLFFGSFLGI